ncbi:hypothetical protein DFH09DRAFT_1121101 [Mycena vulgaris]|nr:hypothetical protein DFH09DRAFT_1121101 [Mycena vulgaris]
MRGGKVAQRGVRYGEKVNESVPTRCREGPGGRDRQVCTMVEAQSLEERERSIREVSTDLSIFSISYDSTVYVTLCLLPPTTISPPLLSPLAVALALSSGQIRSLASVNCLQPLPASSMRKVALEDEESNCRLAAEKLVLNLFLCHQVLGFSPMECGIAATRVHRTIAGQVRTFICLRCDSSLQVLALFIVLANHTRHGCAQVLADAYAAWIGISSTTMFPTPSQGGLGLFAALRFHSVLRWVPTSSCRCVSVPPDIFMFADGRFTGQPPRCRTVDAARAGRWRLSWRLFPRRL